MTRSKLRLIAPLSLAVSLSCCAFAPLNPPVDVSAPDPTVAALQVSLGELMADDVRSNGPEMTT